DFDRAICLLTFTISAVARAENPQVSAIRQQIKVLREEEKAALTHIRANYKAVIENKRLDEHERASLRKQLAQEERQALSLTEDKAQKEKIRSNYSHLRRLLSGEVHLDVGAIHQLHEEETQQIRNIRAVYHAKIKELEDAIKAAAQVKPVGNRKKK